MTKFKFHWGHGMALLMVSFMVFILYMVFQVTNIELVKEDYYEPDSIVNIYIQAQQRTKSLPIELRPSFSQKKEGLVLSFPENWSASQAKGKLELLRPSSSKQDINMPITLDSTNSMLIKAESLREGLYILTLDWNPLREYFRYRIKRKIEWKPSI